MKNIKKFENFLYENYNESNIIAVIVDKQYIQYDDGSIFFKKIYKKLIENYPNLKNKNLMVYFIEEKNNYIDTFKVENNNIVECSDGEYHNIINYFSKFGIKNLSDLKKSNDIEKYSIKIDN